ncbi:MAG: BON domain-containing protein [Vicinamibacterales bacterium]
MRRFHGLVLFASIATAVACASSDPGITTAVKTKFAADETVKAYQIDVDTSEGVVTLSGAVQSQAAKDRAIQLARETDGVARVEDRLTVNPAITLDNRLGEAGSDAAGRAQGTAGSASDKAGDAAEKIGDAARATGEAVAQAAKDASPVVADAGITAAVKTRLLADRDVAGLRIDVDTSGKVVTLTGNVKTAAQIAEAEKIARETPGVIRVVNNLKVGA